MAGTVSRGFGKWGSTLENSSSQRCEYGELVAECRSSEELEDELPLTLEDDELGLNPSDLYGQFTWKIDKFSQINKRELCSRPFDVGGYKWYILIYPQGCDACHHLSLFMSVADHEKLLPGWNHSALFTISVVSKDPKKSKYSDTLHRFWKKEHDWGWKKFMELPKVLDGFFENDTLIIKAQVQVIREDSNCPHRCLDRQYRRELARVYLTQVEQIFRRFMEEGREKLMKFIENKAKWASFRSYWQQIDESTRKWMSSENKDTILRRVIKQFFVDNEVTTILVMDSLYFGLKALEGQYIYGKGNGSTVLTDETQALIARAENEVYVLADDVVSIIERVVLKPLHPKDEKGPQQFRTKDGGSGGDSCKIMNEQTERRLVELGCKTLEIYILGHIFSNRVEIAYQEAVSLQMQEDLIREEAEYEKVRQRSHGKEKKSKKKQAKQKRSSKKEKETMRDKKHAMAMGINADIPDDMEDCAAEVVLPTAERRDASEDVSDLEDISNSSNNNSTVTHSGSAPILRGTDEKRSSIINDSSSTCSADSISSAILNSSFVSFPQYKSTSVPRKKNQQHNRTMDDNRLTGLKSYQLTVPGSDKRNKNDEAVCSKVGTKEAYKQAPSCRDQRKLSEHHLETRQRKLSEHHLDVTDVRSPEKKKIIEKSTAAPLCPVSSRNCAAASSLAESLSKTNGDRDPSARPDRSLCYAVPIIQPIPLMSVPTSTEAQKPEAQQGASQKRTEKITNLQGPSLSKPFSAHVVLGSSPAVQFISSSVAGQTGPEAVSLSVRSSASQSYKSAVIQNEEGSSPSLCTGFPKSSPSAPSVVFYTSSDSVYSDPVSLESSLSKSASGALKIQDHSINPSPIGYMDLEPSSLANEMQQLSLGSYWRHSFAEHINGAGEFVRCQTQADEFPHIDLINYLLDDEINTLNKASFPPSVNFHRMPSPNFPLFPVEFAESNNSFRSEETGLSHNNGFQVGYNSQFSPMNDMMLPGDTLLMLPQISYHFPPVYPSSSSSSSDAYQVYRHGNGH